MADQSDIPRPTVVLVTGSGRSGTSSLAGSLKRLGLHVPQPEVPPSLSNQRGFYEPQWVIDFHKRHLKKLALHNIDSRPQAVSLVEGLLSDGSLERELREWLASQLDHPQIVIKDPHAFWFATAWRNAARDLDANLCFLTALRHPAEVVGSRDIAYLQKQPEAVRRTKETSNVAGWAHAGLLTELAGRGVPRAFVRYDELVSDWRSALTRAGKQLGLEYTGDLTPGGQHEVDDFIDSDLQKSRLTWDDLRVPYALLTLAEEVWQVLGHMVEEPEDPGAVSRLDRLHEEYVEMYENAVATVYDHTMGATVLARRENDEEIARLRHLLRKQKRRTQALEAEQSGRLPAVRHLVQRLRPR